MTDSAFPPSNKVPADLVIHGAAEVLTCVSLTGNLIGRQKGVSIAIAGDRILGIASPEELRSNIDTTLAATLDATGKIIAPGFVDCHTHLVFGGSRAQEYAARMTLDPESIRALGIPTGISATVAMTRAESLDQLTTSAADRLDRLLRNGTTTVESKSGYGLRFDQEVKMLQVNKRLQSIQAVDVVSTFLGAHDFPPNVPRDQYLDSLVSEMIPYVAQEGLAEFCDVYCDAGYYTVPESRHILEVGRSYGLKPKIHVDAYANIGGAQLSADLRVVSADHLNYTCHSEMKILAEADIVGVVMPALDFCVKHPRPFDARALLDNGLTLALATDLCPGCWVESMQVVMQLACRLYKFSPAEALFAATMGGAKALNLDADRGSLEPGKLADLQIWDIPTFEDVIYRVGNNAVETVIRRGQVMRFK